MKNCKNCAKEFPSNSLTHRRSYCYDCSPPKSGNGYDLRKAATKKKVIIRPKNRQCEVCSAVFPWCKSFLCSACRTAWVRYKRRNAAYKYLGGKCNHCGITDYDILTCHHRNPKEKLFGLSNSWSSKNWLAIQQELEKCDLLCCNCHQKLHVKNNQKRFSLIEEWKKRHGSPMAEARDLKSLK